MGGRLTRGFVSFRKSEICARQKIHAMTKKIMIIDDSKTIQRSAQLFLESKSYEIILVDDGYHALGEIYERKPDLIFVDLMMPKLGGFEVCQMVKSHPDFKHIPIVVLSSKSGMFDQARGKIMGADDYIIKPFEKGLLVQTVEKYIGA
jgi:twitching motility two-component system response regulator PilG